MATMTKKEKKMKSVLHEFKTGTLHQGKGGPIVKNRKQAVAIAMSQASKVSKKKAKK